MIDVCSFFRVVADVKVVHRLKWCSDSGGEVTYLGTGLARTKHIYIYIYIYIYTVYILWYVWQGITIYRSWYGVYLRFWSTLLVWVHVGTWGMRMNWLMQE